MSEEGRANPTTELRVIISEGPDGQPVVEYEARIKGTTTVINMRPSHVAGQLLSAAMLVFTREYKAIHDLALSKKSKKSKS
jgi:hypothetical protein